MKRLFFCTALLLSLTAGRATSVTGDGPVAAGDKPLDQVPPSPPPPPIPAAKTPPPQALAEPISPATASRFPHLAQYQGHVLLAGPDIQVVLAGVPPRALVTPWRPAILAAFLRSAGDDNAWTMQRALGAVDLRNSAGPDFQPLAVDLGTDPEQGAAFATFIYAVESQKTLRQLVTYKLDVESGRLALAFDDYAEGENPTKAAHKWHVRLRADGAEFIVPKATEWGGLKGQSHLVAYAGADVLGLVAYRAFRAEVPAAAGGDQAMELQPQSTGKELQPIEGYEFLLRRAAAAKTLRRVDDVRECLHGAFRPKALPRPEARHAWILGCGTDAPKTALALSSPAKDIGGATVSQPVFVFASDGSMLQYTALYAGETQELDLPHSVSLQLADTAQGRLLGDLEPFLLSRGERKAIELPTRPSGRLRLDLSGDKAAAVLSVRRLDARAGEDGVLSLETAGATAAKLDHGSWLVKGWPVQLDLVKGAYEIEVARGDQGIFCRLRVRVRPGEPVARRCAKSSAEDKGAFYADLSFAGANLEPRIYGAALGVDWMARPLTVETLRAVAKNPRDEQLLPVLRAVDEATGVPLQLIPGTPALAQRWARVKPAMAQEVLPAFARMARAEARGAVLELGCPGRGVSLFEYELMAKRLVPDALRLFGCDGEATDAERLDLWTRLSVARREPIILTAASELDRPGGLRFPRLALVEVGEGQDQMRHLLSSLAGNRVTISAGARVEILGLAASDKSGAAAKARGPRTVEATLRVVPTGTHAPVAVVLYTGSGMVKQESLALLNGPTDVKSTFVLPDGALWLRAEVSTVPKGNGSDKARILATTGFVVVADLLSKAQQESAP